MWTYSRRYVDFGGSDRINSVAIVSWCAVSTFFLFLDTPEAAQLWLKVTKWCFLFWRPHKWTVSSVKPLCPIALYQQELKLQLQTCYCVCATQQGVKRKQNTSITVENVCVWLLWQVGQTAAKVSTGDLQCAGWQHKHTDCKHIHHLTKCTHALSPGKPQSRSVPCSKATQQQLLRKGRVFLLTFISRSAV